MGHLPKVIAIVGPTASGKTSLGIYLAQKLKGEVISADSRQVYTGLDIGTGKATKKEMAGVPHHMLDVVSPKKIYSNSDYTRDATRALEDVIQKEKIPIVVGGTGYYIDSLLGRLVLPDVPPNEKLRARLEKKSPEQLFALLQTKDPVRAANIEPHHKRRLIRALEIADALGASPSKHPVDQTYQVLWIGISPDEKTLSKNIHSRLLTRIKLGMVAEARRLHAKGLSYKRMDALGLEYRYLSLLLQKKVTDAEFLESLERAIVHYAKNQKRWFARNLEIRWVKNKTEALRLAKEFAKS
ncbi:MAG: tRNA dimethylallyltransferase [Candidatus Adlerbacteria bacterium]|nr:tRNA dimethylallyltransferase [Candidatus Adlerbacteria bacterium]